MTEKPIKANIVERNKNLEERVRKTADRLLMMLLESRLVLRRLRGYDMKIMKTKRMLSADEA